MVPDIATVVVFDEANGGTLPFPLAARPIAVLVFVQVYVAPVGVLIIEVPNTRLTGQTVSLAGAVITGSGFIVIA